MYDLIIIGGGPAGITAGIYALRKKLKTLIISKDFIGQTGIAGRIENWPGEKNIMGPELMIKFKEHLDYYNPEVKEEEVLSVSKNDSFKVKTTKEVFSSRSVIIATGRKSRKIGIDREEEFVGRGVVYCTTCDAPFFKNKKVVIVGGGNAGFEAAIELKNFTENVSLFDIASDFGADEILQEKAKEKNISLFNSVKIESLQGDKFLNKITYKNLQNNKEQEMEVEGLFVQIGSIPITDFVEGFVKLDEQKNIIVNSKTQETSIEGLFAAGDVTDVNYKQIVISTGEGAKSALSAYRYLKND